MIYRLQKMATSEIMMEHDERHAAKALSEWSDKPMPKEELLLFKHPGGGGHM